FRSFNVKPPDNRQICGMVVNTSATHFKYADSHLRKPDSTMALLNLSIWQLLRPYFDLQIPLHQPTLAICKNENSHDEQAMHSRRSNKAQSEDRGQSGSVAVEFAILAPVLMIFLFGIIEFGSLLYVHNNMENAARETARRMAVGALSAADAQQYADNFLAYSGMTFTVAASEPDPTDPTDTDVSVTISVPMADAAMVGFPVPLGGTLQAGVTMRSET
ncbi:MAG: TadE/TadG family type IV pilus assembly protein, partial [Alphaproteobacteria bacterium]